MRDSSPIQMITVRYYLVIQCIAKYYLCSPFSWYTVEYPTSQLNFLDINTGLKASVNLESRILLHDPLKFKAVFVAKMFLNLSPRALNLYSKRKFKTFFTSKIVY